jgi:hypothetical protein
VKAGGGFLDESRELAESLNSNSVDLGGLLTTITVILADYSAEKPRIDPNEFGSDSICVDGQNNLNRGETNTIP